MITAITAVGHNAMLSRALRSGSAALAGLFTAP